MSESEIRGALSWMIGELERRKRGLLRAGLPLALGATLSTGCVEDTEDPSTDAVVEVGPEQGAGGAYMAPWPDEDASVDANVDAAPSDPDAADVAPWPEDVGPGPDRGAGGAYMAPWPEDASLDVEVPSSDAAYAAPWPEDVSVDVEPAAPDAAYMAPWPEE